MDIRINYEEAADQLIFWGLGWKGRKGNIGRRMKSIMRAWLLFIICFRPHGGNLCLSPVIWTDTCKQGNDKHQNSV